MPKAFGVRGGPTGPTIARPGPSAPAPSQISILELTEQFIAGMARLERHVALERRAGWMVMATRLLLLRSRLLFPASPEAEASAAQEAGREVRRLD